MASPPKPLVATGPGPRWFRFVLGGIAAIYFVALFVHSFANTGASFSLLKSVDRQWPRPIAIFLESTGLFPHQVTVALEYRLDLWVCGDGWKPVDPRPYFTIRPDDKESRFQRLAYFYDRERVVMQALDAYVSAGHAAGMDDGVIGKTGGIRLVKVSRPLPNIGDPVERYHFDPFAPVPARERQDRYYTPLSERKRRCGI